MDTLKRYSINNFFKKFFAFLMILFLFFTQNVYAVIDVNNRFLHNNIDVLSETDYILTINNTSPADSTNANFTHRLPDWVKIADDPNIRNTCWDASNIQTENDWNTWTYKEWTTKFSVNFTKKKWNVIVRYRNKETWELIEEETFEKNVWEVFNPEQKEFDWYIFVEYIWMINWIVSEDNSFNIVDFYYKRWPWVIFAEFVDESWKKLKDDLEIHWLYWDPYEIKFEIPEWYIFKNVNWELKWKLWYGWLITIIFNKKKDESLWSWPGWYYPVKEDDRVKVNEIKISIIDTKKEEENKVEDNKKEEIITEKKEKEEPIIILWDSIVKEYILDDVREEIEEYRKEQNRIQIKLPKTWVDSDFIKNVEEMISSNEMIHEEDKKEIIDKLLDISYDNDISWIQNSIEIVLDKDNWKTFYKFNWERVNEDQLNWWKVLEEIPITIVVETDFSKIDNKNSSILQIIWMIIWSILILWTWILIFIRRKKNQ